MPAALFLRRSRRGSAALALLCLYGSLLLACGRPAPEARGEGESLPAATAPAVFDATGTALWDGRPTLDGIWVAHPSARSALPVRIQAAASGAAVDGALFPRDAPLSGPTLLVSSQAAEALGLEPGAPAELRIVALATAPAGQERTRTGLLESETMEAE